MSTFTGDVCQRMHSHIIESWPFFITFLLICVGFLPNTVVLGKGCPVFTFENGTSGWSRTGDAFASQPVFREKKGVHRHVGHYYIDSRKNRTTPCQNFDPMNRTAYTGTLRSPTFIMRGDKLTFKIGGRPNAGIRVELIVNGTREKVKHGTSEELQYREWKGLKQFENQTARIVLVDNRTDGYLVFDDLRYQDSNFCHNQWEQQYGFLCSCPLLGGHSHACAADDACVMTHAVCNPFCHETDTNCSCQQCICNNGFKFESRYQLCVDIDECLENRHDCDINQHNCLNTEGGYKCVCKRTGIEGDYLDTKTRRCHRCQQGFKSDGLTCSDINECQTNKGNCQHNCINTDGSYFCTCIEGYEVASDRFQCKDIDECATNSHSCTESCKNTPGSFLCTCRDGYKLSSDKISCIDDNECEVNNGGCAHTCENTLGSRVCKCNSGYQLDKDGRSCMDQDECSMNFVNCGQRCLNTNGSYICACYHGYVLQSDNYTCVDVDECIIDKGGCGDHGCVNTIGGRYCTCNYGYKLLSNNITCVDIDECTEYNGTCGQHQCVNTAGGYRCWCNAGYRSTPDNRTCADIDECSEGSSNCGPHRCVNTLGRYACWCDSGYQVAADNISCEDINECLVEDGSCGRHTCINSDGSYHCKCNEGYYRGKNNTTCIDLDECSSNKHNCGIHICVNTNGSHHCLCRAGYKPTVNNSCEDINECNMANNCSHACVNFPGGFQCQCPAGFHLGNDNVTCLDVNECTANKTICDQNCINNEGSYQCLCRPGYALQGDSRSCQDMDECFQKNHECEHKCLNTQGTYQCTCNDGYRLKDDKKSCKELHVESIRKTKNEIKEAKSASEVVNLSKRLAEDLSKMNLSGEEFNETVELLDELQSSWKDKTFNASNQQAQKGIQSVADIGDSLINNIKPEFWKNDTNMKIAVAIIPIRMEKIFEMIFKSTDGQISVDYQTSNIAVQVKGVAKHEFKGTMFPNDASALGDTHVYLPQSIVDDNVSNTKSVGITQVYFKSSTFSKVFQGRAETLNSNVLSIKVLNVEKQHLQNLKDPIMLTFKHLESQQMFKPVCSYLNEKAVDVGGRLWLGDGCEVANSTDKLTVCHCYHLTSYGLLMDVHNIYEELDPVHKEVLGYISLIGCCVSIVFCILSLVGFCLAKAPDKRKGRRATYKLHINLVLAIALSQVCFVAGMFLTENELIACRVVSIATHYFLSASFCWMLVEGINVYNKIVRVFSTKKYDKYFYILGWGVPLLMTTASAAGMFHQYGRDTAICFLPQKYIWLFAGPVVVVILVNLFVLGSIVYVLIRKTQFKAGQRDEVASKVRRTLKICAVLLPLLGVSWIFGFMAVDKNTVFFHYLFAIVNSLQGVFIFFAHCWINETVRTALKQNMPSFRSMNKYNIAEKMRGWVESSVAETTTDMTNVTNSVLFTRVTKTRTSSCTSYVSGTSFSTLELHQPHTAGRTDRWHFIDYTNSKESECL